MQRTFHHSAKTQATCTKGDKRMDTATAIPVETTEQRSLTPLDYMSLPDTAWSWAKKLMHLALLHQEKALSLRRSIRAHDLHTPFAIHPLQCALAVLSEPGLDGELRVKLFDVLLHHELEVQTGIKPDFLPRPIQEMIRSLRCLSRGELGWSAPPEIRLAKLYSLTFNVLDGEIQSESFTDFLGRLIQDAETEFGQLNIVDMGRLALSRIAKRPA
ncbi:MAG: hypothetical protein RDU25_01105 [Patescibacteria group bacterium]|nr:hypothetical protein [Patescibacteria group bacterium]